MDARANSGQRQHARKHHQVGHHPIPPAERHKASTGREEAAGGLMRDDGAEKSVCPSWQISPSPTVFCMEK